MKTTIQLIMAFVFAFAQSSLSLAQSKRLKPPTNLDEAIEWIEDSYHNKLTLDEFIEKVIFVESDKTFLSNKAYENKLEKSKIPKFNIKKTTLEYVYSFNNKKLLKINRLNQKTGVNPIFLDTVKC